MSFLAPVMKQREDEDREEKEEREGKSVGAKKQRWRNDDGRTVHIAAEPLENRQERDGGHHQEHEKGSGSHESDQQTLGYGFHSSSVTIVIQGTGPKGIR
jgi:hypothetical protein